MPNDSSRSMPNWAGVEMSPEARKCYVEFLRRYNELQQQVDNTPLVVIIWGSGTSGGDIYDKRLQIKGRLRSLNYAAVFSEDIDGDCPDFLTSTKARELLQALESDLIVVIASSPGSIAEVHDCAAFPRDIGSKLLVFIDSRYVEGYSYAGALNELNSQYKNVRQYQYPRDVKECFLMEAVEERLRTLRWAKWRKDNLG